MKNFIKFYLHALFLTIECMFTPSSVLLANFGPGVHDHGVVSKAADAVIATRFLIGKVGVGASGSTIAVCGLSDTPKYLLRDAANAIGDYVEARILGLGAGTDKMVAGAIITFGQRLVPMAGGLVKPLPATGGVYWVGATAESAAAIGDDFEVSPNLPYQVTVTS